MKVALGLCLLLISASAPALSPVRTGERVYKRLDYVADSGDLLGMMLRIKDGPKPIVTVAVCEGGCSGGQVSLRSLTAKALSFDLCSKAVDQNGKPVPCTPVRYTGRFTGRDTLIMTVAGDPGTRVELRRMARPKATEVEDLIACNHRGC